MVPTMSQPPVYPPDSGSVNTEERPWGGDPMVWAGGFAAWLLFYSGTAFLLEVLSVFVIFAVVFAGLAGLAVSALAIKRQRSRRATVAVMIILGLWCVWLYAPVRDIGLWVRFAIEESRYVQALDALAQGREPSCTADKLCEFDAGPPARAAFSWGGVVDNWVGVVIDPSDDIMNHERNRGAFGGKLVGCRPIRGHFYLCSFT